MGPNQTYKLLYSKGNYQKKKRKKERKENTAACGMGENSCKWCNWQGINFQNIQTTHTIQQEKNKQPNQKMSRRPK